MKRPLSNLTLKRNWAVAALILASSSGKAPETDAGRSKGRKKGLGNPKGGVK